MDKKEDLICLDNFIVEQVPMLYRRLLLHGNSPMIGYGKLKVMDKKYTSEWPFIGIVVKKNYISIFIAANRNGTPLPQIYAERLGKVGIGKHSIKMR